MTRRLTAFCAMLAATAVVASALPESSSGAVRVRVGFGDQTGHSFSDPLFRKLRIKRVRVFAPWNVALKRRDRRNLDIWLRSARNARAEPLVHFSAATGSRCPRRPCRAPSSRAFRKAFKRFRKRYRWVRTIGVWNEANHRSQPTFKRPKHAAIYYNIVRRYCRKCRIVAADVIDERNMVRWLRVFRRYAKRPRIWGLHNYRDTNPRRRQKLGGTRRLLRTVRRGQVWLTETGGIVKFGRSWPCSETRARNRLRNMFSLARRFRSRGVQRLYVYNWSGAGCDARFDAGLVNPDGSPRPGYDYLRRALGNYLR